MQEPKKERCGGCLKIFTTCLSTRLNVVVPIEENEEEVRVECVFGSRFDDEIFYMGKMHLSTKVQPGDGLCDPCLAKAMLAGRVLFFSRSTIEEISRGGSDL